MQKRRALGIVLAAVLTAGIASGQVTGRVMGQVLDSSGASIPGASVTLSLPGGAAVYATKTTLDGVFALASVTPGTYDLRVAATGFRNASVRSIVVNPAREFDVPPVTLQPGAVSQVLEVSANLQSLQTNNAEIASTITNGQIQNLPIVDRYVLGFIGTQAGVNDYLQTYSPVATSINGQRPSYSNVTFAGINIQDNYLRTNTLDFTPNLLTLDQVQEVTISTSNANASIGGGASQVSFTAPSGTNEFHGDAYWQNRNNALAANEWFNNQSGLPNPFLNQNQVGASLGGPILKNKLFFYVNYEAFRLRQQVSADRTILTGDARQGIFTAASGQKFNVLQAAGVSIAPVMQSLLDQVPGPEHINNFRVGDSGSSMLRNTAGDAFLVRSDRTRDSVTGNFDYFLSTKHALSATYLWNRDLIDRPDLSNDFSVTPKVRNDDGARLLSVAWRWNPTPNLTNELRSGFNLAPTFFDTSQEFGPYILKGMLFTNPVNTMQPNGRATDTYALADNASYVHGRHTIQFGYQSQYIRVETHDNSGIVPTYTLGMGTRNSSLSASQLPAGLTAADLGTANSLLADLYGYVTAYSQTFNVTSRTSGFVNGANNSRHEQLDNFAFYGQDAWKALRRLTLTLGLRYEYFTPVTERDSLALLPVLENNNPIQTLLSNSTLDFAGDSAGRPWYHSDRNNFAPNVGLAWDLFGNGRTVLRSGYSISYVNDEAIRAAENSVNSNNGLISTVTGSNLAGSVSGGLPGIPVPAFQVPRTFADNYALSTTTAFAMPDPYLRTPYVQQWSFGIQQSVGKALVEVRYVGNHATKQLRAFDYNQVDIATNGFLNDFLRAQYNGNLSRAATGVFNPAYAGPGSKSLTVFPQLYGGGLLTDPTVSALIDQGQAGELAYEYQVYGLNGAVNFFPNPNALAANLLTNYSNASYNALQADVTRRTSAGLQYQFNYTFSKVMSDSLGTSPYDFEPFLDIHNAQIDHARTPFDVTHAFKANAYYELPLGPGHRWNWRPVGRLLGGWNVAGLLTWQSGAPFSILSARGTVNRASRSSGETAMTALDKSQLDDLLQFRQAPTGPYFISGGAINTDGRGTTQEGAPPFAGQMFTNPAPGSAGGLQRNMFSGPWVWDVDFRIGKTTRITERQSVDLRMEAINLFNHPSWMVTDQNINSSQFGQITSTLYPRRTIQLSLYYRF